MTSSGPAEVGIESKVDRAARCLMAARHPVIGGLAADVAGIRAAISLARRLGCPFDHQGSEALLAELSVMQRTGWMTISPGEVSRSCDLLLVVGDVAEPEMKSLFNGRPTPDTIRIRGKAIAEDIAMLRAIVSGLPVRRLGASARRLGEAAERLKGARFGVALWRQGELHPAVIEMLMGLVKDLNLATRFSALSLVRSGNAVGANIVSSWLTGLPVRTSLSGSQPVYDPWLYSAERMIACRETDAVLCLATLGDPPPDSIKHVPTVAIVARGTKLKNIPKVVIEVGMPGRDHDGVLHDNRTGALGAARATQPNLGPTAAQVIGMIEAVISREVKAA